MILEAHSAFIPNRPITNNIMIAFEICHFLKRNKQGKARAIALKIDMLKAYNQIEWKFLQDMGFEARWVNLIMMCVNTVSYNVLYNGT